jgi:hypothetical protein
MPEAHITPMLAGGLGNILFQLAGAYGLARKNRWVFSIDPASRWQRSAHSKTNYFDGLLFRWKAFVRANVTITHVVHEHKLAPVTVLPGTVSYISGYLQNYAYFWDCLEEILGMLSFNASVEDKYPRLEESAFLHVRGGDYLSVPLHRIDLTEYYKKALDVVKAPHYYVFTNDPAFLSQQTWLKDVPHTIVDENEVDSLYLMSRCKKGAICANSTFSWWGAALAPTDRPICMPSKWFNDPEYVIQGYFFPGVSVISV